jgi:hypothetical protein
VGRRRLGYFDDGIAAADAYEAARELFGETRG